MSKKKHNKKDNRVKSTITPAEIIQHINSIIMLIVTLLNIVASAKLKS